MNSSDKEKLDKIILLLIKINSKINFNLFKSKYFSN